MGRKNIYIYLKISCFVACVAVKYYRLIIYKEIILPGFLHTGENFRVSLWGVLLLFKLGLNPFALYGI